jgi:hypothetical protein
MLEWRDKERLRGRGKRFYFTMERREKSQKEKKWNISCKYINFFVFIYNELEVILIIQHSSLVLSEIEVTSLLSVYLSLLVTHYPLTADHAPQCERPSICEQSLLAQLLCQCNYHSLDSTITWCQHLIATRSLQGVVMDAIVQKIYCPSVPLALSIDIGMVGFDVHRCYLNALEL